MRITDYAGLRTIARNFEAGMFRRIMIVGSPGLSKTQTFSKTLEGRPHLVLKGRVSALGFYEELYAFRDQPIILDDTAEMLASHDVQELLRELTETTDEVRVSWRTQSQILEKKGLPRSFTTSSPVCVIANSLGSTGIWKSLNSRCHRWEVCFDWPEVIAEVRDRGWFDDEEVLAFAESKAMCEPDVRLLIKAKELKTIGFDDWTRLFEPNPPASKTSLLQVVAELVADPTLKYREDQVRSFVQKGYGSRATFFRQLKLLESLGNVPTPAPIPPRIEMVLPVDEKEVMPSQDHPAES
jgi:hypothetical protein